VWASVDFTEKSSAAVPDIRGVYCFIARPRSLGLPNVGFALYVGETGDTSAATLASRFKDYLREARGGGRLKIKAWFTRLNGHLEFAYVPIGDAKVALKALEAELSDALLPPLSDADYSAEMRPVARAFRHE
jgi:hypothetical protein